MLALKSALEKPADSLLRVNVNGINGKINSMAIIVPNIARVFGFLGISCLPLPYRLDRQTMHKTPIMPVSSDSGYRTSIGFYSAMLTFMNNAVHLPSWICCRAAHSAVETTPLVRENDPRDFGS